MLARLIPFVLSICLANVAVAETQAVETARGSAEIPVAPKTIAVFDVTAADTLNALGVPIAGTLGSLYVDYLDAVTEHAVDLGTFWEPDVEGVHALAPDLIIVGSRSSDQLKAMARLAPAIDMTVGGDPVAEGLARLRTYGDIFGRTAEAAALEQVVVTKMAKVRAAAKGKGTALIVMTNGPKISAYGAGGRFGWLHNDLAVPEAAPEITESLHGEAVSFEFIKSADPDWLIVVDRLAAIGRPGASAAATLDNALVHGTKAWSNEQVIYLNAADVYIAGGGIQSMIRILDQLADGFGAS